MPSAALENTSGIFTQPKHAVSDALEDDRRHHASHRLRIEQARGESRCIAPAAPVQRSVDRRRLGKRDQEGTKRESTKPCRDERMTLYSTGPTTVLPDRLAPFSPRFSNGALR